MIGRIPTIDTLTLTSANTEYNYSVPARSKNMSVRCRTAVDVRMAFVSGKVGPSTDPYYTIPAGAEGKMANILSPKDVPQKVYFASSTAGVVLELTFHQ